MLQSKPDDKQRTRGRPATGTKGVNVAYVAHRDRARELKLTSVRDWCALIVQNRLPTTLPARPELLHPEQFSENLAAGWQDFLGLDSLPTAEELELLPDVDSRGYVEFQYATEMAKTLQLAHAEDWYREAGRLHPCCPREPWAIYFGREYTTLEAFVGLPPATNQQTC